DAYEGLRVIPGYRSKADELIAQFWERRALRSELAEPADSALAYRLRALNMFPTNLRRREAGVISAARFQALRATYRHTESVRTAALSSDGQTVLTGSDDGTARLWDARSGKPLGLPLQHEGPVSAVAFSPDGQSVLTGSFDGTAQLWDAR